MVLLAAWSGLNTHSYLASTCEIPVSVNLGTLFQSLQRFTEKVRTGRMLEKHFTDNGNIRCAVSASQ